MNTLQSARIKDIKKELVPVRITPDQMKVLHFIAPMMPNRKQVYAFDLDTLARENPFFATGQCDFERTKTYFRNHMNRLVHKNVFVKTGIDAFMWHPLVYSVAVNSERRVFTVEELIQAPS